MIEGVGFGVGREIAVGRVIGISESQHIVKRGNKIIGLSHCLIPSLFEMLIKGVQALNLCIFDLANLLRIELRPLLLIESFIEGLYVASSKEIDEGVPDIASILHKKEAKP